MASLRRLIRFFGYGGVLGCFGLFAAACSSEDAAPEGAPPGNSPTSPPVISQIPGFPAGWGGGTTRPDEYELGRDLAIVRGGSASAYLRFKSTQTTASGFIALTQSLRSDLYRGKRVRLSGYLRTSGVTGDGAGLWLRGDAPTTVGAFDNMEGRRRVGTEDWRFAEVVVDVPAEVVGLAFGALLNGTGIVWLDDLKLEVVGTDVPVTAPPPNLGPIGVDSASLVANYNRLGIDPLNLDFEGVVLPENLAATIDWLRTHSVAFLTDDPEASDADLAPLAQMVGVAGIVSLGESTHGTREFFRMKHRVFGFLVRNLGFSHFSIEASLPEALAVDRYVQTGVGDPASVVRGMHFWTWSTEEVIALVQWMRAWNAAGSQPRLSFTGFDMQFPGVAIDSVTAFTSEVSAALGDSVRLAYGCLAAYRDLGTRPPQYDAYRALAIANQDACRLRLSSVDSLFASRASGWRSTFGETRTALVQRLARVVSQWEDYARVPSSAGTAVRDRHMAENVSWWRSQLGGARMVLWAHNAHVSRPTPWMGSELAKRHGPDYLNVALTFSAGDFNAVNMLPSGAFGGLSRHGLAGSWPGSIEAVFDATGMERAIFDARAVRGGGAATPLQRRLTMRTIGSTFAPSASPAVYQGQLALPDDYDLVIWFRNASASRLSLGTSISSRIPSQRGDP